MIEISSGDTPVALLVGMNKCIHTYDPQSEQISIETLS